MTSVMGWLKYFPAIRGRMSFPTLEDNAIIFLYLYFSWSWLITFEATSLRIFLVLTTIIFYTTSEGTVDWIDYVTSVESSPKIKTWDLSFNFLVADNIFKVLFESFLPLCSAITKVAKLFLIDLNSIS